MRSDSFFKPTITKEELNLLPVRSFEGEILLVDTIEKLEKAIPLIYKETLLGFDTETRPSFKKGNVNDVSLLQLATQERVFLFRLNSIGLPNVVKNLLDDKDVLKIGVAIHDDILSLQKLSHFEPKGFIELQQYVKRFGIEDNGLKKLTANILGFKISKRQQTSNWEAEELNQAQISYAATDAWVCYEIYRKLIKEN